MKRRSKRLNNDKRDVETGKFKKKCASSIHYEDSDDGAEDIFINLKTHKRKIKATE